MSIITAIYNYFFINSILYNKEKELLDNNLITNEKIKYIQNLDKYKQLEYYNKKDDNIEKIILEYELLDKNLITYDEINNINLILNKYIEIDSVITYYNNLLKFKIVDLSKVFENNKVDEYNTLSFNINKFKENIKIYIEADKKVNERNLLNSNKIELSKKELLNKENDF
jgi:hypothetical protein